ncbi:MAG: hypothetical protein ACLQLO_27545 [Mycobacterium sp.]
MPDVYANAVSTIALAVAGSSLGWQIKSKWWDRPKIVLANVRVSSEGKLSGEMTGDLRTTALRHIETGWSTSVVVTNAGDAQTTLLDVRWQFDYESAGYPRTFIPGTVVDGPLETQMTDARKAGSGLIRLLVPDGGKPFEAKVLERNQSASFTYQIGLGAIELLDLRRSHQARPVIDYIDRKRRFGPQAHGPVTMHGRWCPTPRNSL